MKQDNWEADIVLLGTGQWKKRFLEVDYDKCFRYVGYNLTFYLISCRYVSFNVLKINYIFSIIKVSKKNFIR